MSVHTLKGTRFVGEAPEKVRGGSGLTIIVGQRKEVTQSN